MSFVDKAEQRKYIILCVELGMSPMDTKTNCLNRQSGSSVSRALVYRWHIRFSELFTTRLSSNRHTIVKESLTSIVLNPLQYCARQTMRGIALRNSIIVTSEHKILTVHMYMISGFSII